MTLAWALLLGFGLGLRHAGDADHIAAVATLLGRDASPVRAARLAALWGLGHSLTFLAVGTLVVVGGLRLPASLGRAAEGLVAAMLILLGATTLFRHRVGRFSGSPTWRPLFIGIVHGLAGSAGVALLALTAIRSTRGALAFLALFGAGTVMGMVLLTLVLCLPFGWSLRRYGQVPQAAIIAAAILSIALGIALGARAISEPSAAGANQNRCTDNGSDDRSFSASHSGGSS